MAKRGFLEWLNDHWWLAPAVLAFGVVATLAGVAWILLYEK